MVSGGLFVRSFFHRCWVVIGDGVRVDVSTGGRFIGKFIQVRGVAGNLEKMPKSVFRCYIVILSLPL